mgnify:CR=1 FL=1
MLESNKKLYYSIKEVSEMTELKPYVLRYWESEFPSLKPSKNRAGNRTYKKHDIQVILDIKKLLYQKKFTIKKKLNSSELQKMLGNNYSNPKVNLDIDFSVSRGGYRLRPHRDDITRLYNFLIYLTDIPKKNGGSLTTVSYTHLTLPTKRIV